jgi:cell wall-associated NlpC family hydrolase
MTDAVAAVQARIAQIRSFTLPATTTAATATAASSTASTSATATASAATSTSGSAFAAALAQVSGTGATAGAADPATVPAGALSTTVTGQDLVESAKKYLGTPYVWGGETLAEGGLDCSGLVQLSLADLGITGVPRVARDQATVGQEVASLDEALPGDLVVLSGGKHIGIYVGDGKMIDAPKPGQAVTIRDVYAEPTTIRRVLPQAAATTASATSAALASTAAGQNALALLTGSTSSSTLPTSSLWGAAS